VTRQGRVAAVTNYRERPKGQAPRSRGELVRRFLIEQQHPKLYLKRVSSEQMAYNGYNLLLGDMTGIYYHSNRISADQSDPRPLKPGIYGLSNHLLDTPWFKVEKGKRMLKAIVSDHTVSPTRLFELLADQEKAPDDQLPESGIDRELEKRHSPIFIQDTTYGTRCSTLLLVNQEYVWFSERQFSPDYSRFQERSFVFPVEHVVS